MGDGKHLVEEACQSSDTFAWKDSLRRVYLIVNPTGIKRASYMDIWRKSTPGRKNTQCKVPGVFDE